MNSDPNPVVVKINMKLKRANATKRSEQLELNLRKEETYKYKYNVEVQNIYERLCIEETEEQPDNGSFNNQCDQKWTTVKQSIKSSLNAVIIIIILAVHATAGRWPPQLAPCTSILGRSHPLTANGFLDVISPSPFGSSS